MSVNVARPALVIFDCDGVLVDSEALAAPVLARAMRSLGLRAEVSDVDRDFRGRSLADCIQEIERRLGAPVPAMFLADLERNTRLAFDADLREVPGVRSVLGLLRAAKVHVCVASSGSHEKIRHSLELTKLLEFFDARIFSASDVGRGKPFPDLFLHAAASLGADPDETVVIEDSRPGVEAGLAAGMQVFAYCPLGPEPWLAGTRAEPLLDMSLLGARLGLETLAGSSPSC